MEIKEKLALIREGKLSAVENTQTFLERIKKDTHNIFLYVNEDALLQAKEVDKKIQDKTAGKLAGLCFAIKSNICVKGLITNCASKTLENFRSPYDADVIEKIKQEDGIILGMVNMDEFACGSTGASSAYGATINPRAPDFVPGGSSSASAGAVSAQLCDIALGSDTGGSIRNPASHCGVVGIKPSYGRISRYGLIDLSMSLDQIGPLCADVYGCALVMEVICGYSKNDPTTISSDVTPYTQCQDTVRCGVSPQIVEMIAHPQLKQLFEKTIESYSPKPVSLSHMDLAVQTYYPLVYVEFFSGTRKFDGRKYGLKIEESVGEEVLRRIYGGEQISQAEHEGKFYRKALAVRSLIEKELENAFEAVDVIVLPVLPTIAPKVNQKLSVEQMYAFDVFTIPANLAGISAAVIPMGVVDGCPVGLQIWAKNEEKLFSFLNKKK
ncbi:MAG: amidase family protein [Candidatus Woesearchaeota archaeon]